MATVRLADYRPAPYLLGRTDLTVRLFGDHAVVDARLAFSPNPAAADLPPQPLVLAGLNLQLESLAIDGVPISQGPASWATWGCASTRHRNAPLN